MLLSDYFDRVAVINLDRRADRLERFKEQADDLGIDFVRYSAIDAQALGISPIQACSQSHHRVLTDAAADGVKRLFVFEDDAEFESNFNSKFDYIIANLPQDWQMLYLGSWMHPTIDIGIEGLKRSEGTILTHAYGAKAEVFDLLIQASLEDMPIDEAYFRIHSQMKVYVADPSIVLQKAGHSDIRGHLADYSSLML